MIKDGYTRVSSILAQWDKFGGIDPIVLQNKADLGTEVHEAIKADFYCMPPILSEASEPYFYSYYTWKNFSQALIVDMPDRLYDDELMITGEVDAIVRIPETKQLVLCDWKCSYSSDPINWPMQGAFYLHMLHQSGYKNLGEEFWFVQLRKDRSQAQAHKYLFTADLWADCLAAVRLYRRQKPWLDKRKEGFRFYE